ncbi:MAG: hypothetical protein A2X86_00955 [Bdellovibrionales bacterium GWA2_49_15]|nr:MAG: hypothetical protein A2X86_00955 [Bdellovibrionales bacterium GWA2_49_15]HAZ11760.1 hypothetical protein [Bdellovibrionales bacterium]
MSRVLLLLSCFISWEIFGDGPTFQTRPIKRLGIALYDSSEYLIPEYTLSNIHRKLEVIFNYFGYYLQYYDVARGVPAELLRDETLDSAAFIVSWFSDDSMETPDAFSRFLERAQKRGVKWMAFGHLGFAFDKKGLLVSPAIVNQALLPLGLDYNGTFVDNPILLENAIVTPYTSYEWKGEVRPYPMPLLKVVAPFEIWLSFKDRRSKKDFPAVAVSPRGALVLSGQELEENTYSGQSKWKIDPFKLVETVLAKAFPVPDPTTLCGKRLLFVHIDGDGFINISNTDRKSLSGQVIIERIIKKYKLPTSASLIGAEIDKDYLGGPSVDHVVQELFAIPYVIPAGHTFFHPLSWAQNPPDFEKKNYLNTTLRDKKHKGPILAYQPKDKQLSYERETVQSLALIGDKYLQGKMPALLFWSGSCRPPVEALALLEKRGVLNINGGDSRFDSVFDSVSHLAPLYRKVGPYTQVYAAGSNENVYTNSWQGPFDGYKKVIETFMRTETPRRLKPVNIYYHFYSGEFELSLKALDEVYKYALQSDLNPVHVESYIRLVRDFEAVTITQSAPETFEISNQGSFQNFRFDQSGVFPDYQKSKNILGHRVINGALYLITGPGPQSKLVLTRLPNTGPYVEWCVGKPKALFSPLMNGESVPRLEGDAGQILDAKIIPVL